MRRTRVLYLAVRRTNEARAFAGVVLEPADGASVASLEKVEKNFRPVKNLTMILRLGIFE